VDGREGVEALRGAALALVPVGQACDISASLVARLVCQAALLARDAAICVSIQSLISLSSQPMARPPRLMGWGKLPSATRA